jgi:hypothetical protein
MAENFIVGHEMDFGTPFLGIAENPQGRYLDTVLDFKQAIHGVAAIEFHGVFFSVAANDEPQPFRQGIDAGNANAMQATRNLV